MAQFPLSATLVGEHKNRYARRRAFGRGAESIGFPSCFLSRIKSDDAEKNLGIIYIGPQTAAEIPDIFIPLRGMKIPE